MPLTSTVCLIAKNEAQYIREWVAYHRVLGFNEIVVYENNSRDDTAAILKALSRGGKVTYRTWTLGARESAQVTAYRDAIRRCRTDWLLFIDTDEFLVLHDHEKVNDFLKPFHNRKEVTAIGLNWRIFGDGGHEGNDGRPVIERFTMASMPDFPVNAHLKSFLRTKAINGVVHMHISETSGETVHPSGRSLKMRNWGISEEIELTHAQVNHYYSKTFEEYAIKKERGSADVPETDAQKKYNWYHDEAFKGHNRNDVEDRSALRFQEAFRRELAEIEALTVLESAS